MKALDRPFPQIINGTTQFIIPIFQRDYSWTEVHCAQLWKDVIDIARSGSDHGHFIGSIVYVATGDTAAGFTRWLLIDGQQRLTTITLLLVAMRDHIRKNNWQGDPEGPTAKRIDAYFLKNLQEEGGRHHKLVLRRHDQNTLQAIIDDTEYPKDKDASLRILENYIFFREQLVGADISEIYTGISRLIVVDVTLDRNADDPQQVFESLNSTGMELSQSDLIRNFVLMRLPEKEQTRLYECYWSKVEALFRGSEGVFDAFMRDYMALKTRAGKQEKATEIYRAFRRTSVDLAEQLGGSEGLLKDILRFARYQAAFSIGGGDFPDVAASLGRLRGLIDVAATLIMRLFDCYDRVHTLTAQDFDEAVALIESYVLRRAVCGNETRGYWQVFANMAYRIDEQSPLRSLKVALVRMRDSYGFPGDDEFQRELEQRDLYGLRVCRHILEQFENRGSKEPTDTSSYSIEHILPQNDQLRAEWQEMLGPDWRTIQQTWLHRLGNLTLTGYNSTYSDRAFYEKKTIPGGFNESSVRLNKYVREQPQWTQVEIETRGKQLSERALQIWPSAHVDHAEIVRAEEADLRELAAKRDVGKVQMTVAARALFKDLSPRVCELGGNVVELAEGNSVGYYGPGFFLEVLPRKSQLTLLLPPDFSEIDDPTGLAEDASEWKVLFYAKHAGGVLIKITGPGDIERAIPIIRQAYSVANASPQ